MSELKFKFRKVMVIDDNAIDLYIAKKLITNNYFSEEVLEFDSANSALNFLERYQNDPSKLPEIIFVDIYMPMMSGFDFLNAYDRFSDLLKQYCRVYVVSSSIDDYDLRRVNEDRNVVGFGAKTMTKDFLNSIKTI